MQHDTCNEIGSYMKVKKTVTEEELHFKECLLREGTMESLILGENLKVYILEKLLSSC